MAIEQFVEPNFRILIGYLLLMRWGCGGYFRGSERQLLPLLDGPGAPPGPTPVEWSKSHTRNRFGSRRVWLLVLLPLTTYLCRPTLFGDPLLPDPLRWGSVVIAVGAILLFVWTKHIDSDFADPLPHDEQLRKRSQAQPFRLVRHPAELSDFLLMMSLAALTGRASIGLFTLVAIVFHRMVVIPQQEAELKEGMGVEFDDYARSSGRILPRLPQLKGAHYQVPKRFGLTAIIGLLTGLSLVFGGLNLLKFYVPVPREVYFFAAIQVLAICIAQMVFGSAPRFISAFVGAALLPAFISLQLYLSGERVRPLASFVVVLIGAIVGALGGYCIGAVAAGFFLVMDWLENWITKKKENH